MKQITYQEAFQTLWQAGFAVAEINRLYHLRQTYQTSELDQAPLDVRRLEFICWLVSTGRLTEELPETRASRISLPAMRHGGSARIPQSPVPFLLDEGSASRSA
jgi:hypothetical protein